MSANLTHRDYARLLASVQRIQECRLLAEYPRVVMKECRRCVGCDSVSYNEMPLRAENRLVAIAEPDNTGSELLQESWRKYKEQHPVLRYMRETGDGSARRISDFLTRQQFHKLDLYQHFFRHAGVEYQLDFCLHFTGETVIGIALNRAERDFQEHSRLFLNLLRPHCAEAYRLACDWRALLGQATRLEEALAATDEGVLLYSDRGIVLHVTPTARGRLSRFFGWRGGRRLPAPLLEWIHVERDRRRGDQTSEVHLPLERSTEDGRLTVRLVDSAEKSFCTVLLQEEPIGVQHVSLAPLGLTPRENEVLAWVTEGKTNGEIGIILGISQETARKHVQHVLEKLGAPNRTAAARIAFAMMNAR